MRIFKFTFGSSRLRQFTAPLSKPVLVLTQSSIDGRGTFHHRLGCWSQRRCLPREDPSAGRNHASEGNHHHLGGGAQWRPRTTASDIVASTVDCIRVACTQAFGEKPPERQGVSRRWRHEAVEFSTCPGAGLATATEESACSDSS